MRLLVHFVAKSQISLAIHSPIVGLSIQLSYTNLMLAPLFEKQMYDLIEDAEEPSFSSANTGTHPDIHSSPPTNIDEIVYSLLTLLDLHSSGASTRIGYTRAKKRIIFKAEHRICPKSTKIDWNN